MSAPRGRPTTTKAKLVRQTIITEFAKWTASSAARRCPISKGERVRELLGCIDIGQIPADRHGFDGWHEDKVDEMMTTAKRIERKIQKEDTRWRPKFCVGWAAKLLNVYLKTLVYVGGYGPPDLVNWLHPPLDNVLIRRLKKACARKDVSVPKSLASWTRIKNVRTYDAYMALIEDLRHLAKELDTDTAFELERFWRENRET